MIGDANKQALIRMAKKSLADARAAVDAPRVMWAGLAESEEQFASRIAKIRERHTTRLLCPMPVGFECPPNCEPVRFIPKLFRALHPDAPKRNRVVSGGRGSGKSHGVATAVILRALDRKMRILGHRGNEWVKVDHFSLKSEAASRSAPSVEGIPRLADHRHDAA